MTHYSRGGLLLSLGNLHVKELNSCLAKTSVLLYFMHIFFTSIFPGKKNFATCQCVYFVRGFTWIYCRGLTGKSTFIWKTHPGLSISVTRGGVSGSSNGLAVGTAAQIRLRPLQNLIRQTERFATGNTSGLLFSVTHLSYKQRVMRLCRRDIPATPSPSQSLSFQCLPVIDAIK